MFNFGGNKFADRDPQNYINSLLGYKSKIQLSPHGEKINDITSEDIVQIANLLFELGQQPRAFDTYESKKHPESPRGLIFFVKFIG